MAKRPTQEQWLECRQIWEADTTKTFTDIADRLGVSFQAVSKHAAKSGWVRASSLGSINRAAQIKADVEEVKAERRVKARERKQAAKVEADGKVELPGKVEQAEKVEPVLDKRPLQSSIELSTDLRSQLIMSHRAEWRRHAKMYSIEELNKKPFDESKKAKISAEMISIRQRAERVAWGMDEKDTPQQTNKGVVLMVGDREVSAKDLGWA